MTVREKRSARPAAPAAAAASLGLGAETEAEADADANRAAPAPEREKRGRLFVTLGALAVAAGLGVAGTVRQDVGGMVLVLGWLLFVIGLHLFGRAASL